MRFDVLTLFPEMFRALTDWGITSRAAKLAQYSLTTWNPRDFTADAHRTVDDRPYGGGPGMVMLARPLEATIAAAKAAQIAAGCRSGIDGGAASRGRTTDEELSAVAL